MKKQICLPVLLVLAFTLTACQQEVPLTVSEAEEIAKEAYIYGFPMVVHYKSMYLYAIDENSSDFKGPFNQIACDARLFTPEDRAVVTPNADTPYCMFWVDIRQEPCVFTLPEVEADRFYHFQLIDLYTHNFAYLGTLTTGNSGGRYLVAETGWKGKTPEGIDQVITCETGMFFVVVRTQMMDTNDLEQVKRIQDLYQLEMLSAYLGDEAPEPAAPDDFPVWNEGDQFTAASCTCLDVMLSLLDPVPEEIDLMKRLARLGIGTGKGFDINGFDQEIREAIERGVKEGFKEMEAFIATYSADPLISAKIFGTREFLVNSARENYQLPEFYLLRAVAAHMGLYGNSGSEAIYPTYLADAQGRPMNAGEFNYTLSFQKDELPPVRAFWSLTMYNALTQLFIHNPLDRYLLNSNMLDNFVFGPDGSLTLYIQKDSPGPGLESNWLPAPDGPFYCVLRLYGPEASALEGSWKNPAMVKADR